MKNKKIIKIIFLFAIFVSMIKLLIGTSVAKYNYNIEFNAVNLYRDTIFNPIELSYSTRDYTNQDVIIYAKPDKKVKQLLGFTWDEENKRYYKVLKENEKNNIIVKDYSGNKQELSYNVDWIDKEKPKIIGAVNNGSYNSPLNLSYSDNVGIKNVEIENRGFLYSEINLTSFDIENRRALDYRATSCKVNVIQKPTDTKKLQFFIDGKLSGETTQNTYTFKNLTPNRENIKVKVNAINEAGKVIDTNEIYGKTTFYEGINIEKNNQSATVKLTGIVSKYTKIQYFVWEINNQEKTMKGYEVKVQNGCANLYFNINDFNKKQMEYTMHIYAIENNGKSSNISCAQIMIGKKYNPDLAYKGETIKKPTNINKLTQKGRYFIKVTDLAGNIAEYIIKLVK